MQLAEVPAVRTALPGGRSCGRGGLLAAMGLALLLAESALAQLGPLERRGNFPTGSGDLEAIAHVLDRVTYGRNEAMMAEIQRVGIDEFVRLQLSPAAIPESPTLLAKLALLPPPLDGNGDPQWEFWDLDADYILRAVYSHRQLNEVMTEFWENHFDTGPPLGAEGTPERFRNVSWIRQEKQAYRDNALGSFRQLLAISTRSAAMMYFLDNYLNRANRGNENYARELLELHTLGVDNGYTQRDVQEVARAFTGWTIKDYSPQCSPQIGDFCYNPAAHDNTSKTILGTTFPANAGTMVDGERVLDLLAAHPFTARFICSKLVAKFVSDDVPDRLLDDCAKAFLTSRGDVSMVMSRILFSPEFRGSAYRMAKVRTPLEFTIGSVRSLEGETNGAGLWYPMAVMGQALFVNMTPTGYGEVGPDWIGTSQLLQRWKWADALTHVPTTELTHVNPWATVTRLGMQGSPDAILDYFLGVLVRGHHASAAERALLLPVLTGGRAWDPASPGNDGRLRDTVGLILGLPEYEKQ